MLRAMRTSSDAWITSTTVVLTCASAALPALPSTRSLPSSTWVIRRVISSSNACLLLSSERAWMVCRGSYSCYALALMLKVARQATKPTSQATPGPVGLLSGRLSFVCVLIIKISGIIFFFYYKISSSSSFYTNLKRGQPV